MATIMNASVAASSAANSSADAVPTTAAGARPRAASKRKVFHVTLSLSAPSEINYKELVRSLGDSTDKQQQQQTKDESHGSHTADGQSGSSAVVGLPGDGGGANAGGEHDLPSVLAGPRSQRYNIIERLEKRYGGGAVVDCSEISVGVQDGGAAGGSGGFERGEEDDYYDSEDSFIDDEELQQNIEDIHGQAKVKTKHSGFFVNAGDEIETIEKEDGYIWSLFLSPTGLVR